MTDEKHTMPPKTDKLGEGNTAEVFRWGEGRVLKLWHSGYSRQAAQHEALIGRAVHALGLPSPDVLEVVELEGRHGVVYTHIAGVSLKSWLLAVPQRLETAARKLGRLHVEIHNHHAGATLPSHRLRTQERITAASGLLTADRAPLLQDLEALPDGDRVCHGDFHPDNVLIESSTAVVIDWGDAAAGPPEADIARTLLLVEGADVSSELREAFNHLYVDEYQRHRALDRVLVMRWYPMMAAARLAENLERLPGEVSRLQAIVRGRS